MTTSVVRLLFRSVPLCGITVVLTACGKPAALQKISEVRELAAPRPAPPANATTAERLGFRMAAAGSPDLPFEWDVPAGWTEEPRTQMRLINLRPAGDPNAECYFSLLRDDGGGVAANVNRWRAQMSLEPLSEEAVARLPKKRLLGGEDAVYVEFDGTYTGMGGDEPRPDYRMAGLILPVGNSTVFIKMVGPRAVLEPEMGRFHEFCASLRMKQTPQMAASAPQEAVPVSPAAAAPPTATVQGGAKLSWTAPEGWTRAPDRTMREVTFTAGASGQVECYVSVLGQTGGGIEANINRWAGQMGVEALDAGAIEALPRITLLGRPAPLVEFVGRYTDMTGRQYEGYMMLGAIGQWGDQAVFIKMVGPETEVRDHKTRFVAFCESLRAP